MLDPEYSFWTSSYWCLDISRHGVNYWGLGYLCLRHGRISITWPISVLVNDGSAIIFLCFQNDSACKELRCFKAHGAMIPFVTLLKWCEYFDLYDYQFLPEASFGLRVLSLPVCMCVCVRVSVRQSSACPCNNSSTVQARITKFGPEMEKTLVKIPIILWDDWPWTSRSNRT